MSGRHILVIDGQGGGIGRQLVSHIKKTFPDVTVTAAGTNTLASAAMMKAGADYSATGENAVIVGCRNADIIVGPVGIVIADSLLGEITPAMSVAVAQAKAKRLLLPFNHCDNVIVGVTDYSVGRLLEQAMAELQKLIV